MTQTKTNSETDNFMRKQMLYCTCGELPHTHTENIIKILRKRKAWLNRRSEGNKWNKGIVAWSDIEEVLGK